MKAWLLAGLYLLALAGLVVAALVATLFLLTWLASNMG